MRQGVKLPTESRQAITESDLSAKELSGIYHCTISLVHRIWRDAGRPGSRAPYKRPRRFW